MVNFKLSSFDSSCATHSITASGTLGSATNICADDYEISYANGGLITISNPMCDPSNNHAVSIYCNADGTFDATLLDQNGANPSVSGVSGPLVITCNEN